MNTITTKPMRDWAADLELGRQPRGMTFGEQLHKLQAKGGESPIYRRDPDYYRPVTGPFKRHPVREWLARRAEDAAVVAVIGALLAGIAWLVH